MALIRAPELSNLILIEFFKWETWTNSVNLRKTLATVKELINKNKVKVPQSKFKLRNGSFTTDIRAISANFNNLLTRVGKTLASEIPPQHMPPECYLGLKLLQTLNLSPVSEKQIKEIVLSLKKSAPGNDDMIAGILNISVEIVKIHVAYICNLSIVQGVFRKN